MASALQLLSSALHCRCPKCGQGALYKPGLTIELRERCENCGLDYTRADAADGPAVFLIFILGALLVPLALAFEFSVHPPLWVHIVLWTPVVLGLTVGLLRPVKSYVIALQFRHRRGVFEE